MSDAFNATSIQILQDAPLPNDGVALSWESVGLALCFVILDVVISWAFKLQVGSSLLIAAVRCMGQLAVVALILAKVFAEQNPLSVAGVAFLLNLMGTFETVVNKSKRRFDYMFPIILAGMLGSTIPVSILGTRFAMGIQPFWDPIQFIPVVGMLCGATVTGVVVTVTHILKEIMENRDKIEIFLAFGASRTEACKPIVVDALRVALTPTINQMSVIGIIAIPGMMTGAILGGSSVERAAKLQMIIMFMISAATALASIITAFCTVSVVVDAEHRIRTDRVDERKHIIWRVREWGLGRIWEGVKGCVEGLGKFTGVGKDDNELENGRLGRRRKRGSRWERVDGEEGSVEREEEYDTLLSPPVSPIVERSRT